MSNSNDDNIKTNSNDFQINVDDDAAIYDSLNSFAACFCCNPFENFLPGAISLRGQAFDLIVVQSETTGRVASSDFLICFDHPVTPFPPVHHQQTSSLSSSSSNSIVVSNMISNDSVMGVGPEERGECEALLEIDTKKLGKVYFPIVHEAMSKKNRLARQPSPNCNCMDERRSSFRPSAVLREQQQQQALEHEQETLLDLTKLLQPGKNEVRYLFRNQKRVMGVAHASIFLWSDQDRVVVCDVDGTITKTNVRGIYNTIVMEKYDSHCHERVCQFMSSLVQSNHCEVIPDGCSCWNPQEQEEEQEQEQSTTPLKPSNSKVHFLYLSSRPIVIADKTRKFLSNLRQHHHPTQNQNQIQKRALKRLFSKESRNDNTIDSGADSDEAVPQNQSTHKLPDGPLLGFGGKLMDVMKMELISFTVHMFKAALLVDQVVTPFCRVAQDPQEKHQSLFVAGFGNTMMDIQAYHMAGMDLSQIYFIDKKSQIVCLDASLQQPQQRESQQKPRSSDINNMSTNTLSISSHFLMVDGAQKTEETDQRPCLRTPLSKKLYKQQMRTVFEGYHDARLASHVLTKTMELSC